jgi:PAS domain S-box-containing protein
VPVESESGDVIAGMMVALDITDRKQAEEEVRHTQAFLDSIVENIPNVVFVKSAEDLRFVRFNKAGEELLGYPRAELIGRNDYDFFPKDEADFFTAKDRQVLEGRQLVDIPEEPIETKSKGPRVLHTKKIPILDEEGEPAYLLGISEDITERKLAEEQLCRAKDEAERANRAKDEFLSRMSHELRTPLNAVLGFAQLLEMDSLPAEQRESVRQILRGGQYLLGLIDEVLDITRIATGRLPLSPEAVSVAEALNEAADLIQPLAAERGLRVRVEDANGLHVLADRQRLKQVLLNLLANGVKYNREGGGVAVTWERSPPDRLRIRIADTGIGIPTEVMERLFAPFARLGAETTTVEGTGLGLALSKGLVEAMGGSIEAESEAGSGSVFTVELRLAEAPLQRYRREGEAGDDAGGDEILTRSILYIEDNLPNLKLIERVFSGRPQFRLMSAMQGRLGLELARENGPDLILLDLHLPDIPGDEVLMQLRQDPATRRIPVVMISADATHGQVKRLIEAGADEYLTKPLDVKRFLETVDAALRGGASGHEKVSRGAR